MQQTKGNTKSIVLYALTIFLSAFLLFQVQPLIGKHILPWFGGTPAVWTTCLLFFQLILLGGYAYAHWLANLKNLPAQGIIHLCLLLATLFLLPIIPVDTWKPEGSENPIFLILGLLAVTVGGPYFMLTTTGPLLQAWFSISHKGKSPYRLYALSNAGSLLGLMSYPFLFEPLMARQSQAIFWSLSYALFIFLCGLCAWQIARNRAYTILTPAFTTPTGFNPANEEALLVHKMSMAAIAGPAYENLHCPKNEPYATPNTLNEGSPSMGSALIWLTLSTCGSVFLLATTNQVTQNVAVVPFLWVLFLSIYLLTFILAFEGNDIYKRWWCIPLLLFLSVIVAMDLAGGSGLSLGWQIAVYTGTLFAACMTCHGELSRIKPAPEHLTFFFLMIAGGGALGGICVAIVAPFIFSSYWEYHFVLISTALIVAAILFFDTASPFFRGRNLVVWSAILLANFFMITNLVKAIEIDIEDTAALSRNFYGVLKVSEFVDDNIGRVRQMLHGKVLHGTAYEKPPWRGMPTSYYGKGTGIWLAINFHPIRLQQQALKIGVIGLGTGTIAALTRKEDTLLFYEINRDVITLSRKWFWYQGDSEATIKTIPGDARIMLERELSHGEEKRFHILVADAFSGDVIPIHLLTQESATLYRKHLRDDGILAIHISNNNFDLIPVVKGMAESIGWKALLIESPDNLEYATWAATWVLITKNRAFLDRIEIKKAGKHLSGEAYRSLLWTDDYASLFHVLKF